MVDFKLPENINMESILKFILYLVIVIIIILLILYIIRWLMVRKYYSKFNVDSMDGIEGYAGTFMSVIDDIKFLWEKIEEAD